MAYYKPGTHINLKSNKKEELYNTLFWGLTIAFAIYCFIG